MFVGFQDELALRYGHDRQQMLDVAWHANATVIRAWIEWDKIAPTRPAHPRDPFDPAYVMTDTDDLVRAAQMRGMEVLFTIWGTPPWANGGAAENRAPTAVKDLEDFSYAIASRYSGRYIGYPFVRFYTVWNEPNLPAFLSPQYDALGRSVAPGLYARLYRAGYRGIKAANPLAQVALGDTSPWGSAVAGSHPPGRFAELLSRVRPRLPFDAWAHHPYATSPDLPPTQLVRWPNVTMMQLPRFEEQLARLVRTALGPDLDHGVRLPDAAAGPRRRHLRAAGRVPRPGATDGRRRPRDQDVRLVRPARQSRGAVAERADRPERAAQTRIRRLRAGGEGAGRARRDRQRRARPATLGRTSRRGTSATTTAWAPPSGSTTPSARPAGPSSARRWRPGSAATTGSASPSRSGRARGARTRSSSGARTSTATVCAAR